MAQGYHGRILRVDLSQGRLWEEEPEANLYRAYLGGQALVSQYLLRELEPGIDPLGPGNKLIFAPGVITGAPCGGTGRNTVGAKSPLTGAYGDAQVGGYWGAELKHAGYDAIIVEGQAPQPVYLWIKDGRPELRDASHLWGKTTAESQRLIRQELGDPLIRTAQIGPAGERKVRFACIINDLHHAAGRTGMGAVMGSKNLKAIAVRGREFPQMASPEGVRELARWLRDNFMSLAGRMHDLGTAGVVPGLDRAGGLPTRNFNQGVFEGARAIAGRTLRDTLLVARRSCWACPVRCKREVAAEKPYQVDPTYGGPEYETLASLGSNCGVDDLVAVCKANEICNAYGLDTISAGAVVAFAMECFEKGLLTRKDTGNLNLSFGNPRALVRMVQNIGERRGLGELLGEGVARAAREIGQGAEQYALHIKGQEIPMHEPRYKQGMGLGYIVSPTGADHCHNIHDSMFTGESQDMEDMRAQGVLEPLALDDLSAKKVRLLIYHTNFQYLMNDLVFCRFVPLKLGQLVELVQAVTGWNSTAWELLKVAERGVNLARIFNLREGFTYADDRLPERFFVPFLSGPLEGVGIDRGGLEEAKTNYYGIMGWDPLTGAPTLGKLQELGLEWAGEHLPR